jgi:hypothetical protein
MRFILRMEILLEHARDMPLVLILKIQPSQNHFDRCIDK